MKILVVYYSQTGQTEKAIRSFLDPFEKDSNIEMTYENITPKKPFPFPWPFFKFFGIFPETVLGVPIEIEPLKISPNNRFDLIILGYQTWYLSPSLPITTLLKSPWNSVFKDTPVITLLTCRNMWIEGQKIVRATLQKLGSNLIGNIVITDPGPSYATFVTTPMWMLTGKRKFHTRILDKYFPEAGIPDHTLSEVVQFSRAFVQHMDRIEEVPSHELFGGETEQIIDRLGRAEKAGRRVFTIWAKLIHTLSRPDTAFRSILLCGFVGYLTLAICIGMPIVSLINLFLPKRAMAKGRN